MKIKNPIYSHNWEKYKDNNNYLQCTDCELQRTRGITQNRWFDEDGNIRFDFENLPYCNTIRGLAKELKARMEAKNG